MKSNFAELILINRQKYFSNHFAEARCLSLHLQTKYFYLNVDLKLQRLETYFKLEKIH